MASRQTKTNSTREGDDLNRILLPPFVPLPVLTDSEKHDALERAIKKIERLCGRDSLGRIHARPAPRYMETGILALDIALGGNGLTRGRITELFGYEGCGKTTLALQLIAAEQRNGGTCVYIDADHGLDANYARSLGVQNDLLLIQPASGEEAFQSALKLVESGSVSLIVIDSIAALSSQAELSAELGSVTNKYQSRLVAQAMRKLLGILNKRECSMLLTNRIMHGVQPYQSNPEFLPGGNSIRCHSSTRISLLVEEAMDELVVGDRPIMAHVVKNRTGPALRCVDLTLTNGHGFSRQADIVNLSLLFGLMVFECRGIRYQADIIGPDRATAAENLRARPDLCDHLEKQLRDASGTVCGLLPMKGHRPLGVEPEADAEAMAEVY